MELFDSDGLRADSREAGSGHSSRGDSTHLETNLKINEAMSLDLLWNRMLMSLAGNEVDNNEKAIQVGIEGGSGHTNASAKNEMTFGEEGSAEGEESVEGAQEKEISAEGSLAAGGFKGNLSSGGGESVNVAAEFSSEASGEENGSTFDVEASTGISIV